ncbi:hypothetical protein JTB14_019093 [Gonioctena quinquepunctata]|nr:hypothetical protein JTB14_019093 [Gonioctena quinquepunctata]
MEPSVLESINRTRRFYKSEVSLFLKNLNFVIDKYKFEKSNIYYVDETGITTVQEPGIVLAKKEQKRVGSATSWECGQNITVNCCMSSTSSFVPPLFIFPRKRFSPLLSKDGSSRCSISGYIQWLDKRGDISAVA